MTKILLVEDHNGIRHLLESELKRLGFAVIIAKNGQEGVERAIAAKPDLILMNSKMPEMNGWQAARILRADPEAKNIPILAATAMSQPCDIQSWIEAGCNDYIIKPFAFDELLKKIKALLHNDKGLPGQH
jgi:two-component system, cell cycle response regulator DivK